MADARTWPALRVEAPDADPAGALAEHLAVLLDDLQPAGIEELDAAHLHWRIVFGSAALRAAAAGALRRAHPDLGVACEDVRDEDWAARAQRDLRRVEAGPFVVAPPWDCPAEPPPGATVVLIEPSRGFGTGHHPSTRLCLRLLAAARPEHRDVIDVGTGSGVLAVAAALRGAARVTAIDTDPEALACARAAAAQNGLDRLASDRLRFVEGDFRTLAIDPGDLVLANLTGALIAGSAVCLAALARPGGHLIVSGFTRGERAAVFEALRAHSLVAALAEDDWSALAFRVRR